jgi:serine/threonine protein kinase
MSLAAGTRLGSYEILAPLGAGGMGEVYRAKDTKLNRDVAIKVLPESFALDADRVARFTREAQVLASLNHPNIAAIYGIETPSTGSGPANALVMELVDGEDLSAIIARGPIALADALPIAKQIADALEAAHEQGIVHRDLKPQNIKARPDGTVKVLDFGLAKAMDPVGASGADAMNSPTMTGRMTQMGIILGTAAYMAPEQAKGKAVDRRADIWAFGVVLHEMLTGAHMFLSETIPETLAHVMTRETDLGALPATTPLRIRDLISRCLEKDPKKRLRDIGEARLILDNPASLAASPSPSSPPTSSTVQMPLWRRVAPWSFAVLSALMALLVWAPCRTPIKSVPVSFLIDAPETAVFTTGAMGRDGTVPVISPDGLLLAFIATNTTGDRMLWVRPMTSVTARPLAGTEGAGWPFWSPDSRTIAYSAQSKLMKIAATGGPATTVCALGPSISARGGTWSRDGVLVFNNGPSPLYRVSAGGGTAVPIGSRPGQFPAFLPDGQHLLFASTGGVWVTSLAADDPKLIVAADTGALFDAHSGNILFGRQGTLWAQAFDPKTLALSGEPFPVAERLESAVVPGIIAFSLSENGTLAYGIGSQPSDDFELAWVDRQGKQTGTAGPIGQYRGIDLSPDGDEIAAHRHEANGGDIWITDVAASSTHRFTFNAAQHNASPVWSPNGKRIAFSSVRGGKVGVYVKNADSSGSEELLFETDAATVSGVPMSPQPHSWTADGQSLLFGIYNKTETLNDLWSLALSGDRRASPLLNASYSERLGEYSPDGKWLAYMSSETGVAEIDVQPTGLTGGKVSISTGRASHPRWRGDSRELYYMNSFGQIMAVDVTPVGTMLKAGPPRLLFDSHILGADHPDYATYAVTKDGTKFLIARPPAGQSAQKSQPIVVVLNWIDGIRK